MAVVQTLAATLVTAWWYKEAALLPFPLSQSPPYGWPLALLPLFDPIVELGLTGALDRFILPGFETKLALAWPLLKANLVVTVPSVCLIAAVFGLCGRAPSVVVILSVTLASAAFAMLLRWVVAGSDLTNQTLGNFGYLAICGPLALGFAMLPSWPRRSAILAGTIAIVVLAGSQGTSPSAEPDFATPPSAVVPKSGFGSAKNLILISIDSLRTDRLGVSGNSNDSSPTIDRLAATGARFTNALSTSAWTLPSHMSMLTGRDALAHGVGTEADTLARGIPTLAETLSAKGFATGAVVSEGILLAGWRGFGRGFKDYEDFAVSSQMWQWGDNPAQLSTGLAIDWIQENSSNPFFFFLHFWDVHYDYAPPPPYDTMFQTAGKAGKDFVGFVENDAMGPDMSEADQNHVLALYDGELRRVDDQIGRLLATLDELGVGEQTAIIVTSDHGDEFFEHGGKGHGRTLYREIVNVPLVMRAPGLNLGARIDAGVSLADIMPTALHLLGVEPPTGMTGQNLIPKILGREPVGERGLYAVRCFAAPNSNCMAAGYTNEETTILRFSPFSLERYAAADIGQTQNLAGLDSEADSAAVADLIRALDAQWQLHRLSGKWSGTGKVDPKTKARLQALGYID